MKKLLFIISIICIQTDILRAQILWQPGTQLTWENFHGTIESVSDYSAYTSYNINYKYKWDGDGNITFSVICSFDENKSLKKAGVQLSNKLLRHEQLHFNLAELYTRKIRLAFSNYVAFHKYNSGAAGELKKIFDKLMGECKEYNSRYDAESAHSKNDVQQAEWDAKITRELNSLDAYQQR